MRMLHKCVRCEKVYTSDSLELKKGCVCGAKVFLFLREENEIKDTEWIEKELIGASQLNAPIILDVENVRVLRKGVFELDVGSLVKNPIVVKDEKGVYYIRLPKKVSSRTL